MQPFWRPAWVEVDLDAIDYNIQQIKKHIGPSKEIMAVLKGNAYGHGAVQVAKQVVSSGVGKIAVALVDEAIELREGGIDVPILVLGYLHEYQIPTVVDYDITSTIYLRETAALLDKIARKKDKVLPVHLKVNTGLNRIGLRPAEMIDFYHFVDNLENIKITGIYSHFGSAAQKDKASANEQLRIFKELLEKMNQLGLAYGDAHIANSAGTMEMDYAHFGMVRTGRIIYGLLPYPEVKKTILLKPALEIKCRIGFIHEVEPGETVGYSGEYKVTEKTNIATLPFGFTDGLISKSTVGESSVLIGGEMKKIISICADMCMVDLGANCHSAKIGDEVVVVGNQNGNSQTLDDFAELLNTSIGEVSARISRRLPRVYLKNFKPHIVYMLPNQYRKI